MLSENIKVLRKKKGLSQEELAIKLNVVRQTISKWEQGLSVPDADLLIAISEALDTSVSTLLGETIEETPAEDLKMISEKLEVINLQLSKQRKAKLKTIFYLSLLIASITVLTFVILSLIQSPYLSWNYNDPETAIIGTLMHVFEFLFVRIAPFVLIASIIICIIVRKKM